ncbi:MAG: hypothetical protein JOZ83_14290 [Silvibacterium sp.]|nr:hypothetical protein [Silvibacterium sp.]
MIRLCSRVSSLLLLVTLGTFATSLAAAADREESRTATFRSDLALISLPAASSGGCPDNTLRFDVTGNGSSTNLGATSVNEFVCLDTSTLLFTAQFTLTGGNGDRVYGTASGFGVPTSATTFDVHGTWTFIGGTGQFRHIKGNGTSLGHVNLVTGAAPHELIGNVSNLDPQE